MVRSIRDDVFDIRFIHRETIGSVFPEIPSQRINREKIYSENRPMSSNQLPRDFEIDFSNRLAMYEPKVEDIVTNSSRHPDPISDKNCQF